MLLKIILDLSFTHWVRTSDILELTNSSKIYLNVNFLVKIKCYLDSISGTPVLYWCTSAPHV